MELSFEFDYCRSRLSLMSFNSTISKLSRGLQPSLSLLSESRDAGYESESDPELKYCGEFKLLVLCKAVKVDGLLRVLQERSSASPISSKVGLSDGCWFSTFQKSVFSDSLLESYIEKFIQKKWIHIFFFYSIRLN